MSIDVYNSMAVLTMSFWKVCIFLCVDNYFDGSFFVLKRYYKNCHYYRERISKRAKSTTQTVRG